MNEHTIRSEVTRLRVQDLLEQAERWRRGRSTQSPRRPVRSAPKVEVG